MAEDGECFGNKRQLVQQDLPISKKQKDDLFVTKGNTMAKQLLEPYGECELSTITLKDLWANASSGHEHCSRFTEYAIDDPNYQGFALAKSMKSLHLAISAAIGEEAEQLFNPKIFKAIKEEATPLLPYICTLQGGQMKKESSRLNAFRAPAIEESAAKESATKVYQWLHKPNSALRAALKFLSKGGVFYCGFVNEKTTMAWLSCQSITEENFVDLCKIRLCSRKAVEQHTFDWKSIK